MGRIERVNRMREIWLKSRADSGMTQEWIAMELGVSKKTVQNWEKGISCPTLFQSMEWFRVLGLNPCTYIIGCIYPELYTEDFLNEEETLTAELISHIERMSITEKKQLLFLLKGNHGSSWEPLLQMITAHCHTNLKSRVLVATQIMNSYEMDSKNNQLYCEGDVLPNLDILNSAIDNAKNSIMTQKRSYHPLSDDGTLHFVDEVEEVAE